MTVQALEAILSLLGLTMLDAAVTAGSALVVAFLVVVAYLAGFRSAARLNEAELAKLAAAEGGQVEAALIDPSGRAALVRLAGGKLLVARAMGDVIGARVAPVGAATVRLRRDRLSVGFGDVGFPTLGWRLKGEAPAWLKEMARE